MSLDSIREIVTELSEVPRRVAGTEGELNAAKIVQNAFEQLGLETTTQHFNAPKILGHAVALLMFTALVGIALGLVYPLPGTVISGLSLLIMVRMFNLKGELWAHLVPRGESTNVIGKRIVPEAKRTFVFSAHIDAGQTGLMFHPTVKRLFAKLSKDPKSVQGPMYIPAMVLLAGVLLLFVRILGGSGELLNVLHYFVLGFLGVSLLVTLQFMGSPTVPGAIDNATGVGAMVEAAGDLMGDPLSETNLYFVGTGSEETGMMGMKHFYKTHKEILASPQSYFFNFESVGGGTIKAVEEEGELSRFKYPPFLIGFAQFMAKKHGFLPLPTVNLLAGTDSVVTADAGQPTLCLIALDDDGVPPNYHEMTDTADRVDYSVTLQAAKLAVTVARELEKEGF